MIGTDRITDLSDLATAFEEQFTRAALTQRKPIGPEACGHCLNCELALAPGVRWCSVECRDEWEAADTRERAHTGAEG